MDRISKPRILFISTARAIGGGEVYLASILPRLKDQYECTVLGLPPLLDLVKGQATTRRLVLFPKIIEVTLKRNYRLKRLYYRLYFKRFLKRNHFDVINLQEFDGAFVESLDFKPLMLTEQTRLFIPPNLQPWAKGLFEKIDKITCVSRQTLEDVIGLGVPRTKCIVIYNGVDTKIFKPSAKSGNYITWVGRLEEGDKNPFLFLKLAGAAQAQGLDYKFRMVGAGSASKKLQAYIKRHQLTNIEMAGAKKHSDMLKIYHQTKILCLTSKTEGLPYAVLEAMACGKPVVATNVGGLREIINNPDVGRLVEVFDEAKILAEIKALMEDKQLYGKISKAARQRVSEAFSLDMQARQISEQYRELLEQHEK